MKRFSLIISTLILAFLLCSYAMDSFAQESFEFRIESGLDESPHGMLMNSENNFVGIIWKSDSNRFKPKSYLYSISSSGDTNSVLIQKPDTVLILHEIINAEADPPAYLVTGIGYHKDSSASLWFSYFAKIDQQLNIVWEKIYKLHHIDEYACSADVPLLLKLSDGGFLHACMLRPHWQMYLFQIDENGDSVAYRLYEGDSAGTTCDLSYNHDSSAYWLHTHFAHYDPSGPESQCIEIDFDLSQTKVMYYPRWFENYLTAKLLPDGSLISSGNYTYGEPGIVEHYLCNFKLDSNFNVLAENYYTHPDTIAHIGKTNLDYYTSTSIYSGGDHNFQIGIWVPGPSWIVIARMNENLDIQDEKYIGGDATYNFKTITATQDSGVLIAATWYDYDSQSYERDVVIMKLLFNDFTTYISEDFKTEVSSAIVYPNPGTDQLSLRTTLYNSTFSLFDMAGNKILSKHINQNISSINVSSFVPGMYTWQLVNEKQILESGKWIKSK